MYETIERRLKAVSAGVGLGKILASIARLFSHRCIECGKLAEPHWNFCGPEHYYLHLSKLRKN
jgi:hypothetical protein